MQQLSAHKQPIDRALWLRNGTFEAIRMLLADLFFPSSFSFFETRYLFFPPDFYRIQSYFFGFSLAGSLLALWRAAHGD